MQALLSALHAVPTATGFAVQVALPFGAYVMQSVFAGQTTGVPWQAPDVVQVSSYVDAMLSLQLMPGFGVSALQRPVEGAQVPAVLH